MLGFNSQEFLKKYGMLYRSIVLTLLSAILTALVIGGGKFLNALEGRAFSTVERRVQTEQFMERMYDEKGNLQERFRQLTSKDSKDSVYVTRAELKELIRNTALDNYETMRRQTIHERQQDEINRAMQRDLKLILAKLDERP